MGQSMGRDYFPFPCSLCQFGLFHSLPEPDPVLLYYLNLTQRPVGYIKPKQVTRAPVTRTQ